MELHQQALQTAQALRRQLRLEQLRQRQFQRRLPRSDGQGQAAETREMRAAGQPFLVMIATRDDGDDVIIDTVHQTILVIDATGPQATKVSS